MNYVIASSKISESDSDTTLLRSIHAHAKQQTILRFNGDDIYVYPELRELILQGQALDFILFASLLFYFDYKAVQKICKFL